MMSNTEVYEALADSNGLIREVAQQLQVLAGVVLSQEDEIERLQDRVTKLEGA